MREIAEDDKNMATLGEEIEQFKQEYENGDIVHKYIIHTIVLIQYFRISEELKWLKTQPEITHDEYLKALEKK